MAPEYFQKQMACILRGQDRCINMIDDILVFGRTQEEHDTQLGQVLSRLSKAGITLKKDKCVFGASAVNFLGVVISAEGVKPDLSKIQAVQVTERPESVTGVRRLLEMVNHVAHFVPRIPEHFCRRATDVWGWGSEQAAAFLRVKNFQSSDCCLA